jgi:hypothetical protein
MPDLSLWTVYKHPLDYPDKFVARRWLLDKWTPDVIVADTLEELREKLPRGLYNLGRDSRDEPQIVETWI